MPKLCIAEASALEVAVRKSVPLVLDATSALALAAAAPASSAETRAFMLRSCEESELVVLESALVVLARSVV
jgi:hypothetical protein